MGIRTDIASNRPDQIGYAPTLENSGQHDMWRTFCKMLLTISWVLWLAAMAWFAVGMLRYVLSADPTLTLITLAPKQTAQAEVYRIREAPLWLQARFGGQTGSERPELGASTTRVGAPDATPGFINPGEPVRIRVSDGRGLDIVVVAAPRSAASATHFYRALWPESHTDGARPETTAPFPKLAKGTSHLSFTVEEVGPTLQGEQIELEISAPIGLKRTAPGWDDISTFIFWPFIAVILGVWALLGAALTWWYRRRVRRRAPIVCKMSM